MQTEIEAKFLDIVPNTIRRRLKNIGAELIYHERPMRRRVFDFPDDRLYKINAWTRVRDEGDKTTLSYKQLIDRTLHGTKELTLEVSDFDESCRFLELIGMIAKAYQVTRREKWVKDDVEITIDTWPWIPTFLEIEGPTEQAVRGTALSLGLKWAEAMHGSVETAYQKYFDVTEEEVDSWELIDFIPAPEWLEKRRR